MKLNVLILLFAVALTGLFSGCRNCYSCLADGENFDMPYHSGQIVIYKNDSQNELFLTAEVVALSLPPDEYCGRIGSGSYYACGGEKTIHLRNNNDSLIMAFRCSTGFNHNVEINVTRSVGIGKWLMEIYKGGGSTTELNGTVNKVKSITIGGKHYSNVYEYQNSSAGIHECTDFVYSVQYGILKFTMRLDNSVETWELVR